MTVPVTPIACAASVESPAAAPAGLTTLVVHCSDGLFASPCDRFVQRRLGERLYDRLLVPGGPAWLAGRDGLGGEAASARAALELLVEAHRLERVVLIAHAGCAFYLQRLGLPPGRCESRQRGDLLAVGRWLRQRLPRLHVAAYFAGQRGPRVYFEPVFGAPDEFREPTPLPRPPAFGRAGRGAARAG